MDKNIQFDNTNSTNQIDLLYLTNMTTCKNNNGVKVDIVNKKEVDFYKKRIFQLCKDMLRNKHANPMVNDSFDHFCCNAIEYFKMTDKTEMIQNEYNTLKSGTGDNINMQTSLPNHNNNPSELSEDVNALMFKKIAKKDDKLDKFVIKNVVKKKDEMVIPEQKQYNLTDVKYQDKGVEVKAKTSMVAMNNKKKKNKREIKKKIVETKQPKTKQPKTKQPKTKQQRNVIDLNI